MRAAGGFSLTLAIESADDHVRKEVLDRATPESLMFDGMRNLRERGFRVRTEQITALPYGATSKPSPINIDADLELVELNVMLKPVPRKVPTKGSLELWPAAGMDGQVRNKRTVNPK